MVVWKAHHGLGRSGGSSRKLNLIDIVGARSELLEIIGRISFFDMPIDQSMQTERFVRGGVIEQEYVF